MLRQVLRSIGQKICRHKIKMTEAVTSIMHPDGDIKAKLPSLNDKNEPESGKRQHEDGNNSVMKKLKADEDITNDEQKKVFRRKKMIIFLVYSGKGYLGMQRNPGARTIESDLMEALLKAGLVNEEQAANPTKNFFQRAARTDKGVSAAGQLCSSMINVENPVEKVNQHLVEQIRVIGIQKVTKRFDSKNAANARTYMYFLPTFAFAPLNELHYTLLTTNWCDVGLVQESYRITDEILNTVNETLKLFKGTRNFHNFTSGKKPEDPSATRYIMEFQIGRPFVRKNLEFAVITVKGQSFMLHQIRKMIGLTIAIVRGMADTDSIARGYGKDKCDIPKAPGLGLMLDRVHYDFYNKKYGNDGLHEPIIWEKYTTEIEKFKEAHIYPTIVDTEREEKSMMNWMSTLHMHNFEAVKDPTRLATTAMRDATTNLVNYRKNADTQNSSKATTAGVDSSTADEQPNKPGSEVTGQKVAGQEVEVNISGADHHSNLVDSSETIQSSTVDNSTVDEDSVTVDSSTKTNHDSKADNCPDIAHPADSVSDSLVQDSNSDIKSTVKSVHFPT